MRISKFFLAVLMISILAALSGCEYFGGGSTGTGTSEEGKVPITTASEEAKAEFLKGRELAQNLRLQDSLAHFDKAISLDPNFATAELGRANSSPTAKEFFEHLNKAVSLADKASEGEKLVILATEAGANGDQAKQKEHLDQLIAKFPNDERVHFQLGGYYFGLQDFPKAIESYKKATELDPKLAPVHNILGYAYRQNGDFENAEKSFKTYIELIPDNPNPYDSYGELLLKMGRFDESIEQYRKALSIDPNFVASHFGIAGDLIYQGKYDEARAELEKINEKARSDGDRATALFGMTAVELDSGNTDKALEAVEKQFAMAEKRSDPAAMAGSLQNKGTILLAAGKADDAKAAFDQALKVTTDSDLSQEIKDNTTVFHHYNLATVALAKDDLETAKSESAEFSKGAVAAKNTPQLMQSHELAGMIALAEKDYDKAIEELNKSSLQNPRNLYRLAMAYEGKGDKAKTAEFAKKASEFYPLPQINYGLVRTKAKKLAEDSAAE